MASNESEDALDPLRPIEAGRDAANAISDDELALFRRFPELRGRIARRAFIGGATPVEALQLEGVDAGRLYVKRDDLSCALYGGNKPRKLEFVIGAALARGSKRLVTAGGLGTHHGLATTILGRASGLETTLILVPQPITREVIESLQLDAAFGAELIHAPNISAAVVRAAARLARGWLGGERPTLVWIGGSSTLGNLGLVSAGLELAEQIAAGELPRPVEIHVAVGSGGTIAGLTLGLALAGLDIPVCGALVTDLLPPSRASLSRAAHRCLNLLRRSGARVPTLQLGPDRFRLDASQLGSGYGAPTDAALHAQVLANASGIALDTTYTAKSFATMLERLHGRDAPDGPVLFWNTFNSVKPVPPESGPSEMPRAIREIVSAFD